MLALENDARIVRWMCNVRSREIYSYEALRTRLKFSSMGQW